MTNQQPIKTYGGSTSSGISRSRQLHLTGILHLMNSYLDSITYISLHETSPGFIDGVTVTDGIITPRHFDVVEHPAQRNDT